MENFKKNKENIIMIFTCIVIMLILYKINPPMFETEDDMEIIALITGRYGGFKTINGIFISPILSIILKCLYNFSSIVPWYSINLYFIHFIALFLYMKIIISNSFSYTKEKKVMVIVSFISLYAYIFYRLNFASTSLFLWFSVWLYILNSVLRIKDNINFTLLGILLAICFLIRTNIVIIGSILVFPIFVFLLVSKDRKSAIYLMLPMVITVLLSFSINKVFVENKDPYFNQYKSLQSERSKFIDTGLGEQNNKTIRSLQKTGWSISDFKLAKSWWTHDENIFNSGKFKLFRENNKSISSVFSVKRAIFNLENTKIYIVIMILTTLLLSEDGEKNRYKNLNFSRKMVIFMVLFVILSTVGLACFRFPNRVSLPIYIYILVLLYVVKVRNFLPINIMNRKEVLYVLSLLIIILFTKNTLNIFSETKARKLDNENTKAVIETVLSNNGKDTIFINSPYTYKMNANPIKEYNELCKYNEIPGVWLVGTNTYYRYLHKIGINEGKDIISYSIDNDKIIFGFYYYGVETFEEFRIDFEQYINENYITRNTNKKIVLETCYDSLTSKLKNTSKRWYLFKIKNVYTLN